MSITVHAPRALVRAGRGDPSWAIADHITGRAMRGAIIWGVVFGLFVISTVTAFVKGYPTISSRQELARSLQPFSMLLGLPRHAETVAGFTSWRALVIIFVIGAIWGLLTSTGLLRGEEDAGRWELLLAGQTTGRRAAVQALLGLYRAFVVMFLLAAAMVVAVGRMPAAHFTIGGSVLFAAALGSGAAIFLAVGALTSQISATRGQAATVAAAVLGASYVIRMVADSRTSLAWMRWLSPIGWVEELHPLQSPQPLALVPMVALVLACSALTVLLAGRRDLNGSILRENGSRFSDAWWLAGPITLAVRMSRGSALAWILGIGALAAMYGSLLRAASNLLTGSPAFTAALGRLGVRQATEGYLGIVFLMLEVILAVMAAGQIAAIRDEEGSGRLDNLLVRPVHRVAWLAGRMGVSLALVLLTGLGAGLFTWLGAASQRASLSLPKLVEAGLNASVPAIFVLGASTLVLGLRPRGSAAVAYGIVAWSFLVEMLGALLKGNEWLHDSSLFAHIALAPAAKPDWGAATTIVLLGAAAAALGAAAFQRRDVEYS
jgi:ABC-2 type transport system permease protein